MLKKILLIFISSLLVLFLGLGLFLYFNKSFIKNQTINALNSQLDTEVAVKGKIDLNVFSSFPKIDLSFQDVFIADKLRVNDTLASVRKLDLSLDLWSIINKDYTIDGISARDGFIQIFTAEDGMSNFDILKPQEDKANQSTLLQLSKISLYNLNIEYLDLQNNITSHIYTKESHVSGSFYEQDFELSVDANLLNKFLEIDNTSLLAGKNISGKLKLAYQSSNSCISFSENSLYIDGNQFVVNGDICGKELDIVAKASGDDLKNALQLIPSDWLAVNVIKGNGSYSIDGSVIGNVENPNINVDFKLSDGNLAIEEQALLLNKLSINGSYSNENVKAGSLMIQNFSADVNDSKILGDISIPNLETMRIEANLNGNIEVDLLNKYIPESINLASGNLQVNALNLLVQRNALDSLWELQQVEGALKINECKGFVKSLNLPLTCSGELFGQENYLGAINLKLDIGENNLRFDGELKNLIEIILNTEQGTELDLGINGDLSSTHFNLNDFIQEQSEGNSKETKDISLPPINGKLNIAIEEFVYQKLILENLEILATAKSKAYNFKINRAETLGGSFTGNLLTNVIDSDFEINLSGQLAQIDIKEMFLAFDNFGQESMGSNNIKGTLNSQVNLSATWKNFSDFDQESFFMQSHIELTDGELMNFKPLLSLSGKLDVEQLEHLYFTDLNTDVMVKNKVIEMSMTKIQTNLLSLEAGGKHSFTNDIDYKLILNLKNLLAAKFKKNKTTDENFVNDIAGGINIYISMTGTIDDPVINYDKQSVKAKIKEDFSNEKEEFKNLFKKDEKSEFEKNEIKFEDVKEEDKYLEWED